MYLAFVILSAVVHVPDELSYNSQLENTLVYVPRLSVPPAANAVPSSSNVHVCHMRGNVIEPVSIHVPVSTQYNSQEAVGIIPSEDSIPPPAMRTSPFCNGETEGKCLAFRMLPVVSHVPVSGLYSSQALSDKSSPATTKTLPLGSNVAVCSRLAFIMLPVVVHFPVAKSYSSQEESSSTLYPVSEVPKLMHPPVTRTLPFCSNVAV